MARATSSRQHKDGKLLFDKKALLIAPAFVVLPFCFIVAHKIIILRFVFACFSGDVMGMVVELGHGLLG